jgi:hypothetical protein
MTSVQDVSSGAISVLGPWTISDLESMSVSSWARIGPGTPSVSHTNYDIDSTILWTPPGSKSCVAYPNPYLSTTKDDHPVYQGQPH